MCRWEKSLGYKGLNTTLLLSSILLTLYSLLAIFRILHCFTLVSVECLRYKTVKEEIMKTCRRYEIEFRFLRAHVNCKGLTNEAACFLGRSRCLWNGVTMCFRATKLVVSVSLRKSRKYRDITQLRKWLLRDCHVRSSNVEYSHSMITE